MRSNACRWRISRCRRRSAAATLTSPPSCGSCPRCAYTWRLGAWPTMRSSWRAGSRAGVTCSHTDANTCSMERNACSIRIIAAATTPRPDGSPRRCSQLSWRGPASSPASSCPRRCRLPESGRVRSQGVHRFTPQASGRVPHVRRRARAAVRGQGAQPQRPGRNLLCRRQRPSQGAGAHGTDRRDRSHGDQLRDRGAAARIQSHQGAQTALQRGAARRQELSLHSAVRRAPVSAADVLPGRAQRRRPLLRPLPQCGRAARIRDQLAALKRIQAQQVVTAEGHRDVDVFAIVGEAGEYAVSVMLVRGGRNLGTTSYFPRAALAEAGEALASFVMQYYASAEAPAQVLLGTPLEEAASLAELLSSRTGHAVEVRHPLRGLAVRWVELTRENAVQALRMRFAQRQGMEEMLLDLSEVLDLPEPPARMECFDISHTGGEGTVASCVVFGPEGPLKKEYRRFNITGVTPGDDYAALRQALERRYARIRDGEIPPPEIGRAHV